MFSVKHGMHGTPTYRTWCAMKSRCNCPAHGSYKNYGGRGIKVCKRWTDDFLAFLSDMGPRPFPSAQIDRIDNSKDYSPSNCRWSSNHEQQQNTRRNKFLTYKGKTLTYSGWSRETGLKAATIYNRVQYGWTVEQILTSLPNEKHAGREKAKKYKVNGENLTMSEWSDKLSVSIRTLTSRLDNGWSYEETFTTIKKINGSNKIRK